MREVLIKFEASLFLLFFYVLKFFPKKFSMVTLFPLIYALSFNKKISITNISNAFPNKSKKEVARINRSFTKKSFSYFIDFLKSAKITEKNIDKYFGFENYDIYEKALKKGNGVLLITPHFGNFLLGFTCSPFLARTKTHSILDVESTPRLRDKITKILIQNGSTITRRKEWKNCLDALKRNEVVILVADQAMGNKSVAPATFFGKELNFPIGPLVIGHRSKAEVIPFFTVEENGRYVVKIQKPLSVDYSKEIDAIKGAFVQEWALMIEEKIKEYPDHYFWRLRL